MLVVRALRASAVEYFVASTGRAAGEDPGRWAGPAAERLGLRGVVEDAEFRALMSGRDPWTDRLLHHGAPGRRTVGVEFVLSTPKSLSVLAAIAPSELARSAELAHAVAVGDALDSLANTGIGVRRQRAGTTHFMDASSVQVHFVHRSSRALDPHLHTHVVLAGVAHGMDGLWSALDTRRLFAHAHSVGSLYEARLRWEVAEQFRGVLRRDGNGLDGLPVGLEHLFSTRTNSVNEAQALNPSLARRTHFTVQRPAKNTSRTWAEVVAEWKDRARLLDVGPGDLQRVIGQGPRPTVAWDIDRVVEAVGARSRVTRLAMSSLLAEHAVHGATGAAVRMAVDVVMEEDRSVPTTTLMDRLARGVEQVSATPPFTRSRTTPAHPGRDRKAPYLVREF